MATTANGDDRDFGFTRNIASGARRSVLPDPKLLLMVFRRRLWLFLIAVLLVLSAVALAVLTATPRYVATASVLIEPRKSDTIDLQSVVQGLPADTNVVDTQVQILGSPTTALAVVRRLHLDRDPEFVAVEEAGPSIATKAAPAMTSDERLATSSVLRHVAIKRAGLTYVIDITAEAHSGEKATAIANAFAAAFIADQAARRNGVNENAASFVGKRADELRGQAVADDAAVQRYTIANNLMSANGETMAEQEVSQLNEQIAEAQSTLAQERGKLAAARGQVGRGGGGADIGAVLASETIRNLRQQEATASATLAILQARYGDLYPEVAKAKNNLADVRAQLAAERQRIISTLQANVQVAQSGLASLEASRGRARGSLVANSTAQVGLLELQRKAEASRAVYTAFLQRAKETAATANLPQADASISSLARLPDSASWPNKRLAALVGVVLALVVGFIAIGVAEYLDGSIGTREDVENRLDALYAGGIPDLASAAGRDSRGVPPHVYVLSHPFSSFTESLRAVGSFALKRDRTGAKVLAITSALPREGKTTLSICLARMMAMGGKRVVLVDGDLRRHSVTDILLPGHEERLLRVLDGTLPLEQALVKDDATDLWILPTAGPTDTQDYMTPARVDRLFAMLRAQFDVAIVDTAPVLGVVDTRALAQQADVTLLIARWRQTAVKAAQTALDTLDQAGAQVGGVALSMVDIRKYASTGHAETYGYHKKFTGYYVN